MLPVLRPDLPTADELRPFLHVIDQTGVATNGGDLVTALEKRLGGVAVANATLGLELAAQYTWGEGTVRVPAFTFPASATAVQRAGLRVVICDVDRDTWAAVPDEYTLMVCPFGQPVAGVLVDAAGVVAPPKGVNAVQSFHATKPIPAGEGGMVFGDDGLLEHVRRARNFGLDDGLSTGGTNAKMSEYHAAVALASLLRFPRVNAVREQIAARYADNLKGKVYCRPYCGGTVYPVLVDSPMVAADRLRRAGFETRRWYCPTLDMHPAFRHVEHERLPVAHDIASRLLCLPFHTFMTVSDVDRVCEVLCES